MLTLPSLNLRDLQSKSKRHSFFVNIGGDYSYYGLTGWGNILSKRGRYSLEFGARVEFHSKWQPKNRFHVGVDISNHWQKEISADGFSVSDKLNLQFPIGYTYRTLKGLYLNAGLEFTTERYYIPMTQIGLGLSFGK